MLKSELIGEVRAVRLVRAVHEVPVRGARVRRVRVRTVRVRV
jgi:hypothetical protein